MSESSTTQWQAGSRVWFSWILMGIAGLTDAVGFLFFAGLYVSFMSGDVTQTGIEIGQWNPSTAATFLGAQLLFVCGVAIGHFVPYRVHRLSSAYLMLGESALLAVAGTAAVAVPAGQTTTATVIAFPCTVVAMGIQNAVLHEAGGSPVGTMLTGTLVRLGRAIATKLSGGPLDVVADFGQWFFFVCGAVLGTVSYMAIEAATLLISATLAFIIAVTLLVARPQWATGTP
ncbi:YoaK family protein [Mycobacterium sp. WMMD1722]|uniref:YoaK family protein n=1 Tax=Mycobacterium sp. WMMD1722 TaxID=3404117 RepID=UPI003BF51E68